MVFRRDDGVFGAALLDELGPVFRVIVGGCKGIGLLHVVGKRDVAVVEGPAFRCFTLGIGAPVDEDSEFGVAEPFHSFGFLFGGLAQCVGCRGRSHGSQGYH